jgi:hypothetical protein
MSIVHNQAISQVATGAEFEVIIGCSAARKMIALRIPKLKGIRAGEPDLAAEIPTRIIIGSGNGSILVLCECSTNRFEYLFRDLRPIMDYPTWDFVLAFTSEKAMVVISIFSLDIVRTVSNSRLIHHDFSNLNHC